MDKVEIEIPTKLQEFFRKNIDNEVGFRGDFTFVNGRRIRLESFR